MDGAEKWLIEWYAANAHRDGEVMIDADGLEVTYRIVIDMDASAVKDVVFSSRDLAEQCLESYRRMFASEHPGRWCPAYLRRHAEPTPERRSIDRQQHEWLWDWLNANSSGRTLATWSDTYNRAAPKWEAWYMAEHSLLPKVYFRNAETAEKYKADFESAFPVSQPFNSIKIIKLVKPIDTENFRDI